MWFASPDARSVSSRARPRVRRRRARKSVRFAIDALLGALLMVTIHVFVIQVSIVRGNSMEPALHDGDRLVVDRVTYNLAGL